VIANLLDLALVVVLALYGISGYRRGFVVSMMSLVGFVSGGALGMLLLPVLMQQGGAFQNSVVWRPLILIFGVLALAAVGQGIAVGFGSRLRSGLRVKPARVVDSVLGAFATLLVASVLIWFMAGAVRGGAPAPLAKAIGGSRVLQTIDPFVPPFTARLFAGFRSVIDSEGFPRVFEGVQAEPIAPVAPPDDQIGVGPGVAGAAGSVVKITGLAASCNRGQEGSGWVVAPERVVTNAHVVAGMASDDVRIESSRQSYVATVVAFDPRRDLAVLAVPGLPAPALTQGRELRPSESAVVAGYPLDGPYRVGSARVRDVVTARGADIYGNPGTSREVYSLFARVEPGNSGGPLLSTSGAVVGIVFAKSLDDDNTGYALTMDEARPVLAAATRSFAAVSTGECAAK
jgi:S1-C subfamily serine protease